MKLLLAPLKPYIIGLAFAVLTAIATHMLDRMNSESQHRDERRDARHREAALVFDTTIVMFSRISTRANAVFWGRQTDVSKDSINKLGESFSHDTYEFESQAPRLMSLIEVYFDPQTMYFFKEALAALEREQRQVAEAIKMAPGTRLGPGKLHELMAATMYLSEHMARFLAADST